MPDYLDAIEDYEASDFEDWPEAGDWSEARKKRAPTPQKYAPPAANKGYVSNATFQTSMDKVRADVAANRTAITNVGSRVDTLSKRTQAEVKKAREQTTRDRDTTASTLQMLAILPMLSTGGTVKVPAADGSGPVAVETPPNTMTEVLPLLMLSGFGGTTGSGGSSSTGGMDSGMLLAVALIASQGGLGKSSS